MVNTKFEAYKLRRELKRSGNQFEFKRAKLNAFKNEINMKHILKSQLVDFNSKGRSK